MSLQVLNVQASLPKQLIRVLLSENGQDLSDKVASHVLQPYTHHLDNNNSRQVIKARREIIEARYEQAFELAKGQLEKVSQDAKQHYKHRWQREIDRLNFLKQQEGLALLQQVNVTPEAIRVLVVVKP